MKDGRSRDLISYLVLIHFNELRRELKDVRRYKFLNYGRIQAFSVDLLRNPRV